MYSTKSSFTESVSVFETALSYLTKLILINSTRWLVSSRRVDFMY